MLNLKYLNSNVPLHWKHFISLRMHDPKELQPKHNNCEEQMTIKGQPKAGISYAATNNKLYLT